MYVSKELIRRLGGERSPHLSVKTTVLLMGDMLSSFLLLRTAAYRPLQDESEVNENTLFVVALSGSTLSFDVIDTIP